MSELGVEKPDRADRVYALLLGPTIGDEYGEAAAEAFEESFEKAETVVLSEDSETGTPPLNIPTDIEVVEYDRNRLLGVAGEVKADG